MAEEKFSYKEAIGHGWAMTRKYWAPIALVIVCWAFFQVSTGMMGKLAGQDVILKYEVLIEFKDAAAVDEVYGYLQKAGYIDQSGRVQDALQAMTAADELSLVPELEAKRAQIYNFLNNYRYRLPFPKVVYNVLMFIVLLMAVFISVVMTRFWLAVSRDQAPEAAELFSNVGVLLPVIAASFCYGLILILGFVLLIVPGFIVMIMFQMYMYLIIDKGLGPIAALKRSRAITQGQKWRLFVFGLLIVLLNIAGLLCLLVGVFVTIPVSCIAGVYIYDCLENGPRETVSEELPPPASVAA